MGKKILIIEDNPSEAEMTSELLAAEGFEVHVALSGKEGMAKALDLLPDLIVLDLILPDTDGFELCNEFKNSEVLKGTLVVVLSVRDNIDDITKAFEMGADDYVIKLPMPGIIARKAKLYLGVR